jgi:hypothetical protein
MKITIEVDISTAAFGETSADRVAELERIFSGLGHKIASQLSRADGCICEAPEEDDKLRDANGNQVGFVHMSFEEVNPRSPEDVRAMNDRKKLGMYEVERYGGRQIRKDDPDRSCMLFQFDTLQNLEAWCTMMRTWYTPSTTAWHINKEALIVAM